MILERGLVVSIHAPARGATPGGVTGSRDEKNDPAPSPRDTKPPKARHGSERGYSDDVILELRAEFYRRREAHLKRTGSKLTCSPGGKIAECKAVRKVLKWLPEFIQGDPIDNFHGLLEFMDVTVWSDGGSWWDVKRSLSGLVKAKGDVTGGFTRLVSAYGKSEQHVAPQPDRVVDGVIQSSDRAIDGMRVPTPEQLCAADGIPPTEENLKKVME